MLVGAVATGLGLWVWHRDEAAPSPAPASEAATPQDRSPTKTGLSGAGPLSPLAPEPDWAKLNRWQSAITREDFLDAMENVYTVSGSWREWFHLGENDVLVETGVPNERFRLRFANPGLERENARPWRGASEMPPAPADQPLKDVKIAIDPGHIGGSWAKIEERWFQLGNDLPVQEGDMTLLVARLLVPRLEALGAEVSLVRETNEPVTPSRPADFMDDKVPDATRRLAEQLFYRTAEIRARAEKVNTLRPDLVLCLHFNAEPWGDPAKPALVDQTHFHLILNGAYTAEELANADQRHDMMQRIVSHTHREEAALGETVAAAFVEATRMPPFLYEPNSTRAVNVNGNPYLWARNLLANRVYQAPVVFLEPYLMNGREDYQRIQAGDYEGMREVAGKPRPSIFREYADAVTEGLNRHYRKFRPIAALPAEE
jgi:N-acetylmuramoyl-L-alanine amidase